jgi:hypothetical protein
MSEVASMLSGGPRPPPEILLQPSSFPQLHVLQKLGAQNTESGVVAVERRARSGEWQASVGTTRRK